MNMPLTAPVVDGVHQSRSFVVIPLLFLAGLLSIAFSPRIALNDSLFDTFIQVILFMMAWFAILLVRSKKSNAAFQFRVNIMAPHYVQAMIQTSIFVYWSWYWELINHNALLIVSQLLFAFAFDALLSWSRGNVWRLGFGPFPIIFSINLFMCFKDEWFVYQFLLIAFGFLAKEFITWTRNERKAHIFNPSAITLFVFSILLIVTNSTDLTWAEEIAIRLNDPDNIYLYLFMVGLIVQLLFYVTLVTLASALTLFLLNLAYTGVTGSYWFLDAGIPIAVFLGIHLLITDPATSPRSNIGRFLFGCLYGASVFGLYGLLEFFGEPRFYDKLLCVPVLNLLVIYLDRIGAPRSMLDKTISAITAKSLTDLSAKKLNLLHVTIWIGLFLLMYNQAFIGPRHEGQSISFWQDSCEDSIHNACVNLRDIYRNECHSGQATRCSDLANLYKTRTDLMENDMSLVQAYATGCEYGNHSACIDFVTLNSTDVQQQLEALCAQPDGEYNCFVLAGSLLKGLGIQPDLEKAASYFITACEKGVVLGCAVTGDLYLYGVGVTKNTSLAMQHFGSACSKGYAPACMSLSSIHRNGTLVEQNEALAHWYRKKACAIGLDKVCEKPG